MLALLFVVLAVSVAGHAASEALWAWQARRSGEGATTSTLLGPVERLSSSAFCAVFVLIAINWALALPRILAVGPLLGACALCGAAGAWSLWRSRSAAPAKEINLPAGRSLFVIATLTPIVVFVLFVLWRSSELPVLAHDGLNYHMPKAALLVRSHGFAYFPSPNSRIPFFPFNHELLFADVMVLTGSDEITEWASTATYVLFILSSGALAERWWGRGLHVLGGVLVIASMPVAILHAGAHKNDLLACALMTVGAMWSARAIAREELAPAALGFLALTTYAGTKFQGAAALAWAVPVTVLFGFRRRRCLLDRMTPRLWLLAGVFALLVAVLLGLVPYVANVLRTGRPTGVTSESVQFKGYWDFKAFAWFLYMGLAVPFSASTISVWVPWRGQYWWWPSYDHMFSHCGVIVTVLTALLPLAVWRYRRKVIGAGEPVIVAAIVLPVSVTFLLLRVHPFGIFNTSLRWVAHVPAIVVAWTLVPFLRELFARGKTGVLAGHLLLTVTAAAGASYLWTYALNDAYIPASYLKFVMQSETKSRLAPTSPARSEYRIDEWARADDTIAVDGDFSTYIYPAYGEKLTRTILYVPAGDGPPEIPEAAQWVIVDRSWERTWNHPKWKDVSTLAYLLRGTPPPADLRVLEHLEQDPRFRLVYQNSVFNQAVFLRVGVDRATPRSPFDDRKP